MTITEFPITTREASATGNELVTAATPAAARTTLDLDTWLSDQIAQIAPTVVKLADFNPDISGATSSSQAIMDALNSLPSSGGSVVFPPGATLLAKNIRLARNQRIIATDSIVQMGGSNASGTVNDPDNPQEGILKAWGSSELLVENIEVIGGTWKGLRTGSDYGTLGPDDLFQFRHVRNLHISGIKMEDVGQDGIELKSCQNVYIHKNKFERILDAAIELRGGENLHIWENRALDVRNFVMSKGHAVLGSEDIFFGRFHYIHNNYARCFNSSILLNWPNHSVIEHNDLGGMVTGGIDGRTAVQIDIKAHPVTQAPPSMDNIRVSDNIISDVTTNTSIRVIAGDRPSSRIAFLRNRVARGNKGIDFKANGDVTGNEIYGGSGTGIDVDSPSGGFVIVENNNIVDSGGITSVGLGGVMVSKNRVIGIITVSNQKSQINNNTASRITLAAGAHEATVDSNKLSSGDTCVSSEGDDLQIVNNQIDSGDGSSICIRSLGARNLISGNRIKKGTSNQPVISILSGGEGALVIGNSIVSSGTGAGILINAGTHTISNNHITGGNQNIRIASSASRVSVMGNTCQSSNFQGIDIQSGASKSLVTGNTVINASSTPIQDNGTETILANNRTD